MPILYGPFQSILKNKDGKKLFYPRVLRAGNVSTSQISKEIAAYSSLSPGDVKNTLDSSSPTSASIRKCHSGWLWHFSHGDEIRW